MTKKQQRDRRENILSIENNQYYNSNTYDTNPNQKNG